MLLRYLYEIELKKATKVKQSNGTYLDTYELVNKYKVAEQTLESEVDASVYGADINKMIRLNSPHRLLEEYLVERLNNEEDNISKYYIFINGTQYKIKAVSLSKIDIERY